MCETINSLKWTYFSHAQRILLKNDIKGIFYVIKYYHQPINYQCYLYWIWLLTKHTDNVLFRKDTIALWTLITETNALYYVNNWAFFLFYLLMTNLNNIFVYPSKQMLVNFIRLHILLIKKIYSLCNHAECFKYFSDEVVNKPIC